jgi:hypothetical protein
MTLAAGTRLGPFGIVALIGVHGMGEFLSIAECGIR